MFGKKKPVAPRNGHALVTGVVARISGCANQRDVSLEDQEAHAHEITEEMFNGRVEYRVIATKGKGERLDRPELVEVEAMLRTRELDLLVAEDLGRIVRGGAALRLCGIAVDHGTRVLAPNDGIDTDEPTWEEDVLSACRDHVGHNSHTSKRIKQKMMNRFKTKGEATSREIFGYINPPGAKTFDDWQKDPAAVLIYREWFLRLRETLNCTAVADWLNELKVPTGPYARRDTWDGAMVRRITRNPLLKGFAQRGAKHTVKHNETGRRISVNNPEGPNFRACPHLAFWTEDEFDDLNALLDQKNEQFGPASDNGVSPRTGVSRKRTRFPGQHARCWYCGRRYVWGGNGMTENLMCSGSREHRCWNSFGFCGALAAARIVEVISAQLYHLDGFDAQFRDLVQAAKQGGADLRDRAAKLQKEKTKTAREKGNVLNAIAEYGPKPMFEEKLKEVEHRENEERREERELERLGKQLVSVPESIAEIRRLMEDKFRDLATDSPEFGDLMRLVVPEIHVHLVRLCDGGHPMPRARIRLNLGGIIPELRTVAGVDDLLTKGFMIYLFDKPPQRERIREASVRLAAEGFDQREIARRLPERASQAAVQEALALDRRMRELGLKTPYVLVEDPPQDYSKLRRHRNPKYRFEPLEGYQRPPI
jgi:site-specific DNA recombinase